MIYDDKYHPRVKKDLKKFSQRLRNEIKSKRIPAILVNPEIGKLLMGDLAGIWSYHFTFVRQQYRIAYVVDKDNHTIFVLMIGKREHFYSQLKRRI